MEIAVPVNALTNNDDMRSDRSRGQNRSISVGGSVTGSAMITGDRNTTSLQYSQVSSATSDVDIREELNAINHIFSKLSSSDRRKIDNAFADAEEELDKPQPDKAEVGKALERAIDYASKALGFASEIDYLKPHLTKTVAWLGSDWHKLLRLVS
ncbi:MAG: hypothetical protein PUP92_19855 [Rhizonema sp. PD38]|nr:hypothetical protein [Rhizonema sp. PD38]